MNNGIDIPCGFNTDLETIIVCNSCWKDPTIRYSLNFTLVVPKERIKKGK